MTKREARARRRKRTNKDYQEIVLNDLIKKETITLNSKKLSVVILNDEHSSL